MSGNSGPDDHFSELAEIRRAALPTVNLLELHALMKRLDSLNVNASQTIRIAMGGNATLNYLVDALRFYLQLCGFKADIFLAEFGTFEAQAFDETSRLYQFKPDIIWHFSTVRDFLQNADAEVSRIKQIWQVIRKNSEATILQNNLDLPALRAFGHLEAEHGISAEVFAANARLTKEKPRGVVLFDYDWLSSLFGKTEWFAERFWYFGKYPFSVDATALVAHSASRLIAALTGRAKKCLVLDLDNTLWGGFIGEDGLEGIRLGPGDPAGEAYYAFQKYILSLKERGVILGAVSKNDESVAIGAFAHPCMLLKREDFAVIVANWNNKAENLRVVAKRCGISLDSLVFVDDSPFERGIVRRFCPEVEVPEMPEDPADFALALDQGRYFETATFSEDDRQRARMYRENADRQASLEQVGNVEEYLASLEMRIEAKNLDTNTVARTTQLINKTNQFNLTGTRMTEAQLENWCRKKGNACRVYRLVDRFGDNGWVSAVTFHLEGEVLTIQSWVMSCRVLMRKVEEFVQFDLSQIAFAHGVKKIAGTWRSTGKNEPAKDHFLRLGYHLTKDTSGETHWELEIASKPEFHGKIQALGGESFPSFL